MPAIKQKPVLYFVPIYIGSLKYFAKLVSYLSPYYQVEFLLVRGRDKRRVQMEEYLTDNKYVYHIIDQGLKSSLGIRVPFFTPVWGHIMQILACRRFLKKQRPDKIVMVKNLPPYNIIVKEANRLGIDTVMLQWAYGGNKAVSKSSVKILPTWQKFYYSIIDLLYGVVDFSLGGISYVNSLGSIDRVGIMNEAAIEVIEDRCGISPEKMTLVGSADQQIIHELRERIERDTLFRKNLQHKYGITQEKRIITVLAWGLHKRKRWGFSFEEHIVYLRSVLELIRKFFPPEKTDILLKLHPGDEPALYDSLRDLSVRVFGDEAETDELICLADLCILDPWTAANILVIASGAPAIFVNFSRLTAINAGKELYHLKEIATTREHFNYLLKQFRAGQLPLQYNERRVDIHAIEKIVALINSSTKNI